METHEVGLAHGEPMLGKQERWAWDSPGGGSVGVSNQQTTSAPSPTISTTIEMPTNKVEGSGNKQLQSQRSHNQKQRSKQFYRVPRGLWYWTMDKSAADCEVAFMQCAGELDHDSGE